jgi:hypothetical protein
MFGAECKASRKALEAAIMITDVKQMLQAANEVVPRVTPAQAREMISKGNTLVVDVRDAPAVQISGKIAGAVSLARYVGVPRRSRIAPTTTQISTATRP